MTTPNLKLTAIQLGGSADPSKNFLICADGTLTIKRGNDTVVATIDAAGKITALGTLAGNGVIDGTNAATGQIGEYIEAQKLYSARTAITSGLSVAVTSITLQPGDWEVSGQVGFSTDAGTTVSRLLAYLSTDGIYSNDVKSINSKVYAPASVLNTPSNGVVILPLPPLRVSSATATTVLLDAQATFGTTAMAVFGVIRARRIR